LDRILVIEPDDRVAGLIGSALVERGYVVDRIDGGPRAADLAVGGDYALVLLELLLPVADGRAVLEQIHRERPDRKVFVVSTRASVSDRIECFDQGAVDFLSKPFDLQELLARIEVRVSEGRPRAAGQRRSGHNLALDPTARQVRRGGKWVRLTEREYRLLSHLVDSGTRVCSREELLAGVWGITDDDGSSTYVEMYIHKLRTKLGRDAIKTVRGSGYCVNGSIPTSLTRTSPHSP
jgi:DNA-binding response OmpR family regulator